jgi:DNA-binding transcriptional LysR family regulator
LLDWDDLRIVLAVERASALAAAARQLGVNESTVARRVARAEARLGARLFERAAGRLTPTAAGSALVRRAERIELEVQAAQGAVAGADARAAGTVRVTAVPIVANRLLAPALVTLRANHPGLTIELIAEPRDLSLTRREADIAVRLARPERDLRAVARRIGILDYGVYAVAAAAAADLPWISYEDRMRDLPQSRWIAGQAGAADARPPVLVHDAETLLQCVLAGLGKSLLPSAIAERQPALARIDGYPDAPRREIWLMVHPDLRSVTRVRVVMEWLVETVTAAVSVPALEPPPGPPHQGT